MPIHANENLYSGINPHLSSLLQAEGAWESFHSVHITHLYEALESTLPAGYLALPEKSLQISAVSPAESVKRTQTKADIAVYQVHPADIEAAASPSAAPTLTLALNETIVEEDLLTALTIYRVVNDETPGRPITRIELLSPANKPGGSHYPRYVEKRLETLRSGLCLVEIDYLHESPPVVRGIPSYAAGDVGAYAYLIVVSDPRPQMQDGRVDVYGFGVTDPIPQVTIPLADADTMLFDFGSPYQHTFAVSRYYRQRVDYRQIPANFTRYSVVDREAIQRRMAEIAADDRE